MTIGGTVLLLGRLRGYDQRHLQIWVSPRERRAPTQLPSGSAYSGGLMAVAFVILSFDVEKVMCGENAPRRKNRPLSSYKQEFYAVDKKILSWLARSENDAVGGTHGL